MSPTDSFLVPEPFNTTDQILECFASVGFSPQEGVVLLSSHSITGADTVDPTIPSSSDNAWLANIFIDVLLKGTLFPGYAISSFVLIFAHMAIIEMIPDRESSRQLSTLHLQSDFEVKLFGHFYLRPKYLSP
jgi:Peroxidase